MRVRITENVELLLLDNDLCMLEQIGREGERTAARNNQVISFKAAGNDARAFRPANAVLRKTREFRISCLVRARTRNQQRSRLLRSVYKPLDIRNDPLGARHVQFPARQHEIPLRVHFPENNLARRRCHYKLTASSFPTKYLT